MTAASVTDAYTDHAILADSVRAREYQLVIEGKPREASDGARSEVFDPSTGAVLATVPEATPEDVQAAVDASREAQPGWHDLGLRGRSDVLKKAWAALTPERVEEFARIDAVDSGNPLQACRGDAHAARDQILEWIGVAQAVHGRTLESGPADISYTRLVPYGVVARIAAFNHPFYYALAQTVPAMLMGNSVLLKPSHQTPLSSIVVGGFLQEFLPAGVLNVVTGGASAGTAISEHPAIKRIAFTGSVETGLKIVRSASQRSVKNVSLELGGKNALIVFPDVDPTAAAEAAVRGMNLAKSQGQACGSTSRVFVHATIKREFEEALAELFRAIRVGPAGQEASEMGPLVSREHHERVTGFVSSARADGARLLAGGDVPADLPSGGYYLSPTLYTDVDMGMRVAREEIFGPVLSVLPWSDVDDVINAANSVPYGLTGSVYTGDLDAAFSTAHRLEAGYVWINDVSRHHWGMPFGGVKQSGVGREESVDELYTYAETQVVNLHVGRMKRG